MDRWEIIGQLLSLLKQVVVGPHKVVRGILGNTDEARYMDAGFYLTSTGWASRSALQVFRLDVTVPTLGFVFGLVFIMLGLAVIAKKHKL